MASFTGTTCLTGLLWLLVTAAVAQNDNQSPCRHGYINTHGYCFKVFESQSTTAFFARWVCENNLGHLVYIDSQEKNAAVLELLQNYTTSENVYIDGKVKTRVQLVNYEREDMTFDNWDRINWPRCVTFNVNTGAWSLASCEQWLDFVCEMYW